MACLVHEEGEAGREAARRDHPALVEHHEDEERDQEREDEPVIYVRGQYVIESE